MSNTGNLPNQRMTHSWATGFKFKRNASPKYHPYTYLKFDIAAPYQGHTPTKVK
jgi:hypothetical protein